MKNPIAYAGAGIVAAVATLSMENANAQEAFRLGPGVQIGRANVHRDLVLKTWVDRVPIYQNNPVWEQTPTGMCFRGYQSRFAGYQSVVKQRWEEQLHTTWNPCAPNLIEQIFGCPHERRQLQYICPPVCVPVAPVQPAPCDPCR